MSAEKWFYEESAQYAPIPRDLTALGKTYMALVYMTRRHGLLSLGRMHTRLFPDGGLLDRDGVPMFIPGDPHFIGYWAGHESHVAEVIREVVRGGDICVDVGANIGYFTALMAARAGAKGAVHAFEIEAENLGVLRRNAALAHCKGAGINVHAVAVSSSERELALVQGEASTLHSVREASAMDESRIQSVSLDSFWRRAGLDQVRLLKVDVEGHERDVVKGAAAVLTARLVDHFVIEVTPGRDAHDIEKAFGLYGYTYSVFVNGAWRTVPLSALTCRADVWARWR